MSTFDFMIYIYHVIFLKNIICLVYVAASLLLFSFLLKYSDQLLNYLVCRTRTMGRYAGIIKPIQFPLRNNKA